MDLDDEETDMLLIILSRLFLFRPLKKMLVEIFFWGGRCALVDAQKLTQAWQDDYAAMPQLDTLIICGRFDLNLSNQIALIVLIRYGNYVTAGFLILFSHWLMLLVSVLYSFILCLPLAVPRMHSQRHRKADSVDSAYLKVAWNPWCKWHVCLAAANMHVMSRTYFFFVLSSSSSG